MARSKDFFDPAVLVFFGGLALGLYLLYDQSRKLADNLRQIASR